MDLFKEKRICSSSDLAIRLTVVKENRDYELYLEYYNKETSEVLVSKKLDRNDRDIVYPGGNRMHMVTKLLRGE